MGIKSNIPRATGLTDIESVKKYLWILISYLDKYFNFIDKHKHQGILNDFELITASAVSHNSLGGLQGGTTSQYYHLTATQSSVLGVTLPSSALTADRVVFTGAGGLLSTNSGIQYNPTGLSGSNGNLRIIGSTTGYLEGALKIGNASTNGVGLRASGRLCAAYLNNDYTDGYGMILDGYGIALLARTYEGSVVFSASQRVAVTNATGEFATFTRNAWYGYTIGTTFLKLRDNVYTNTSTGIITGKVLSYNVSTDDGTQTERISFHPRVADGASAVGYFFDTFNALSTAGAKILSLRNQGTEKFYIDKDGYTYSPTIIGGTTSGGDLALISTSHATKGSIGFGGSISAPVMWWDENTVAADCGWLGTFRILAGATFQSSENMTFAATKGITADHITIGVGSTVFSANVGGTGATAINGSLDLNLDGAGEIATLGALVSSTYIQLATAGGTKELVLGIDAGGTHYFDVYGLNFASASTSANGLAHAWGSATLELGSITTHAVSTMEGVRIKDAASGFYSGFIAHTGMAGSVTYTLPVGFPASNKILQSSSAGALSWVDAFSSALASAHIFVGNAGGVATDVAMSGDVTIDNTGATTIGNDKVTYAKMQNISATSRVLGRITAGAGDTEELTSANVKTILSITGMNAAVFNGTTDADSQTTFAHGLTTSKILGAVCSIRQGTNDVYLLGVVGDANLNANATADSYRYYINGSNFVIDNVGTNLQGRAYRVVIFYTD